MRRRITVLLLCLAVAVPSFVSCVQKTEDPAANTEGENDFPRAETPDSLPENLNFEGTDIHIFYFGEPLSAAYDGPGELGTDNVTTALFHRNASVEKRLNVRLNWIMGSSDWDSFPAEVSNILQAGAGEYDIIMEENSRLFQQSMQGYYHDLMHNRYIDLSKPWWYSDLMEESSLDNSKRFFLTGDICLTTLFGASAAFFHKELYDKTFGDVSQLYNMVQNGTWTVDAFMRLCREVAEDVNGDGIFDDKDILGFRYEQWGIPNYMSMSTGLSFITRDREGFPVLDIYNEHSVRWADTLYRLLYTDNMSRNGNKMDTFLDGKSLFLLGQLSTAHAIRGANFAYGLVPYPKLSEDLEYTSAAATVNGCGVGVPVSTAAEKLDAVYASIEALCAESYRKVVPAWFDTAMKFRYVDDGIDARMVDLIYETIGAPFIMMADKVLDTGSVFTRAVYGSTSEGAFTTYWAENETRYNTNLAQLIEDYKGLQNS